jgi:hypothetical protein
VALVAEVVEMPGSSSSGSWAERAGRIGLRTT